jgi:dolichol-phosphate mannosyltransferase
MTPSFLKFCVVGFTGLFVDTGLFNLFRITVLSSHYAALASGIAGMVTTFLLNNYWSFKERQLEGMSKKMLSLILYVVISFVPIFVRSKLVGLAGSTFGDTFIVTNTAFAIGIVLGLIWNFTMYSKIIWRKSK